MDGPLTRSHSAMPTKLAVVNDEIKTMQDLHMRIGRLSAQAVRNGYDSTMIEEFDRILSSKIFYD